MPLPDGMIKPKPIKEDQLENHEKRIAAIEAKLADRGFWSKLMGRGDTDEPNTD